MVMSIFIIVIPIHMLIDRMHHSQVTFKLIYQLRKRFPNQLLISHHALNISQIETFYLYK